MPEDLDDEPVDRAERSTPEPVATGRDRRPTREHRRRPPNRATPDSPDDSEETP